MGIRNFGAIVKRASAGVTKVTYHDLAVMGIVDVAIDASVFLYRFVHNAANKRPNSHLDGFYQLFLRLMKCGLHPVLIFDGHAPQEKKQTLESRAEHKQKAADKLATLQQELATLIGVTEPIPLNQVDQCGTQVKGTPIELTVRQCIEQIHKADKNVIHFPPNMYDDIDRLCRLMNVPILRAVGEADVLCAQLYRNGQVQAIMSEDSDILLYGGGHLIRKFGWTNEVELVVLNQVLQSLHLSYDQFVDVALLTGTDYTESIKGMGPVGVIEAIVHGAQLEQMVKPSDLKQYQEARQLIRMAGTKEKPQTIPPFNFRLYQVDQLTHWMSEMCHYRPITIIKHYDQLRTVYTPRTKIKIVLKGASPVGGLGDVVPASHEVTLKNTTHTSCIVTLKSKSP